MVRERGGGALKDLDWIHQQAIACQMFRVE